MDNVNEPGQTETWTAPQESQKYDDSSQSQSVGTIYSGSGTNEEGTIGHNRTTPTGFFAGKRTLDEAIVHQLLGAAKKSLKNAEACIDWYEEEKRECQKQVSELEQLLLQIREAANV